MPPKRRQCVKILFSEDYYQLSGEQPSHFLISYFACMHACTYLCVGSMSSCPCPLCPLPFRQGLSLILEPFYFVFTFIKSCNLQVPEAHPPSYLSPIVPGFQMCVVHPASFIGAETLNSELRTSCLSNKLFYPLSCLPRAVLILNFISDTTSIH